MGVRNYKINQLLGKQNFNFLDFADVIFGFVKCIILFKHYQRHMNFLNFLTSGAGIFNFNLQNMSMNSSTSGLLRSIHPTCIQGKAQCQIKEKSNETVSEPQIPESNKIMEKMLTTSQSELLSQHQQLINQYMHLNIQLLSQKIQSLEHQPTKKQEFSPLQIRCSKKKIKKVNVNCGHNDKQHYAKGMCNNCYHKNGRTKKPWRCQHQKLYANGLCQNCYINKYNKMKRQKNNSQDGLNFQLSESKQFISEAKIEEVQQQL